MSFGNVTSYDAYQLQISSIPKSVINGQSVRFFPKIMKEEQFDDTFTITDRSGTNWIEANNMKWIYVEPTVVEFFSTGTLPDPLVANKAYLPAAFDGEFLQVVADNGETVVITDSGTGTHTYRYYRCKELSGKNGATVTLSTGSAESPWIYVFYNDIAFISLQIDDEIDIADSDITEIPDGTYFVVAKDGYTVQLSATKGGDPILWEAEGTGTITYDIPPFSWDFGDGTGSNLAMPTHTYADVAAKTWIEVVLQTCDSSGHTRKASEYGQYVLTLDTDENMPEVMQPGFLQQSIILTYYTYNSYHEAAVNYICISKTPNDTCNFYLTNVISEDSMDKIGTLKFRLTSVGDVLATQIEQIIEGNFIDLYAGRELMFSGKIRRVTNAFQAGSNTATTVGVWDVECDNHLATMRGHRVNAWAMPESGQYVSDSPGNILRRIMTPADYETTYPDMQGDFRGIIQCVGANVAYKLNSTGATDTESAGSQYQHIINLHELTNYDLRVRPIYCVHRYHKIVEVAGGPE